MVKRLDLAAGSEFRGRTQRSSRSAIGPPIGNSRAAMCWSATPSLIFGQVAVDHFFCEHRQNNVFAHESRWDSGKFDAPSRVPARQSRYSNNVIPRRGHGTKSSCFSDHLYFPKLAPQPIKEE